MLTFTKKGAVTATLTGPYSAAITTTPSAAMWYVQAPYKGNNTIAVGVSGTETITVGSASAMSEFSSATFNLANYSALLTTDRMMFGSLTINGVTSETIFLGQSEFCGMSVHLNTSVEGRATLLLQSALVGTKVMSTSAEINGAVGASVTIAMSGCGNHGSMGGASLTIDKPHQFAGTVDFETGSNSMELKGLAATSYGMFGDVLALYNGHTLVDTVTINDRLPNGTMGAPFVERNATGIVIGSGTEPGTALTRLF